jgi:Glycosyltransferases, probably involved in cell wall biogenesis
MNLLYSVDYLFFILIAIQVLYLFIFAVASFRKKPDILPTDKNAKRIVILVPAYQEDAVIFDTVSACLAQNYPEDKFDVVVISDKMTEETNITLENLPIILKKVALKKSSKAKSLSFALNALEGYDIAVVLDADNVIDPLYLQKINSVFIGDDVHIVQTHRTAKNLNTSFAILDAISEEINNSIFRKGHSGLGMSAALIGSGMAFDFSLYRAWMDQIKSISGEDKELEHICLAEGYKIIYLDSALVLDEKIQRATDFRNQRKRWLSAQFEILVRFLPDLGKAIKEFNLDFCDKVFQMVLFPRILLLGGVFIISVLESIISLSLSVKWWCLFGILIFTLLISIPRNFYSLKVCRAIFSLPRVFILIFVNLFRLKGAGQSFIHTPHGVEE